MTQAREHIIKKTFKALEGAPRAVVHLYNSTSVAQREQVFKKSKEEIKQLAVDGAVLLRDLAAETDGNFRFQYSPESFSGTEVDYAVDVCNAVLDVWQPKADNKAIINIPTTVENAMPHVFATQIEYINKHLKYRDGVVLCLHPHNDRGCGVATSELGVLAGAEEIEGTLFGNGERTGNVDIVTLAMNLYSHGVDPQLDFSNLPEIREKYETFTRMKVGERQPYAGDLVFSAFSSLSFPSLSHHSVSCGSPRSISRMSPMPQASATREQSRSRGRIRIQNTTLYSSGRKAVQYSSSETSKAGRPERSSEKYAV